MFTGQQYFAISHRSASAVRSDSVRRRSEIVMCKQTLHPLKTYELTHIIGQKLINLMLKVGLYYNIDYFCN